LAPWIGAASSAAAAAAAAAAPAHDSAFAPHSTLDLGLNTSSATSSRSQYEFVEPAIEMSSQGTSSLSLANGSVTASSEPFVTDTVLLGLWPREYPRSRFLDPGSLTLVRDMDLLRRYEIPGSEISGGGCVWIMEGNGSVVWMIVPGWGGGRRWRGEEVARGGGGGGRRWRGEEVGGPVVGAAGGKLAVTLTWRGGGATRNMGSWVMLTKEDLGLWVRRMDPVLGMDPDTDPELGCMVWGSEFECGAAMLLSREILASESRWGAALMLVCCALLLVVCSNVTMLLFPLLQPAPAWKGGDPPPPPDWIENPPPPPPAWIGDPPPPPPGRIVALPPPNWTLDPDIVTGWNR
jgi:hypothetical protein